MYVCALDRPWLSTPFPFQGFVVKSGADIKALKKYCEYVYVDVLRGVPPSADSALNKRWRPGFDEQEDQPGTAQGSLLEKSKTVQWDGSIKASPIRVRYDEYPQPKAFQKELKRTEKFQGELSQAMTQVMDDIRVGRGLEVTPLRRSASNMLHSVIRHPDAFVWMIKLRDKDAYAYGHAVRSSVYGMVLGRHIGLNELQMETLALGALLSQIGKARLPKYLLEKRDPLSSEELEKVRAHVDIGVDLLDRCVGINDEVVSIVQNYHERFDGTGYPNGLVGDQIPLLARITGLVDAYDAMTSRKPYSVEVLTTSEAMDYLYDQRDVKFQGQLVEEFIQSLGIYPTGTLVELSTGQVALIIEQNYHQRIQPTVLIVLDRSKRPVEKVQKIDLRAHNAAEPEQPISIKRALASGEYDLDAADIMTRFSEQKFDWRRFSFTRFKS
nr:cyclic di-GMP phosphodiesterase PA4108-like [Nerophis lumbriciformis]